MKKNILLLLIALTSVCFAEGTQNQKRFISGNIQDKTQSVRAASGEEAVLLSKLALDFAINSKEILGNDRDLDALAISGVLSLPADYINSASETEVRAVYDRFLKVYNLFSDVNVKIAVLNRLTVFRIADERFPELLNAYMKKTAVSSEKDSLTKAVISTLGYIGNKDSFVILYLLYSDSVWASYREELKNSVTQLLEKSVPQAISIIQTGSVDECRNIFDIVVKNEKFSKKLCADISENVLSRTITIYENSMSNDENLPTLQYEAFSVLAKLKWTRSSKTAMRFFSAAKKEYEAKLLSEERYIDVITNLPVIAPVDSVQAFCACVNEMNAVAEKSISDSTVKMPSDKVLLAFISALGAIGDKNAFDTLLAVTYYAYPENVIAQARDALASLKW